MRRIDGEQSVLLRLGAVTRYAKCHGTPSLSFAGRVLFQEILQALASSLETGTLLRFHKANGQHRLGGRNRQGIEVTPEGIGISAIPTPSIGHDPVKEIADSAVDPL
jgi:hypothetical protein